MRKLTTFLLWPTLAGILVAIIMLGLFPQQQSASVQKVEIKQVEKQPDRLPQSIGPVSYAEAVNRAAPAVVNIYTSARVQERTHPLLEDPFFQRFFDAEKIPQRERIQSSLGSGVILSEDGYLLTNNHVIRGADTIIVALRDGREARAEVIGTDPDTDLAVLKINLDQLPTVTLTSSDSIAVGDVVLAIGNPFGVGQTVTMGIVSATGRNQLGINTFENFIQTDAAINPGNSGGALIDAHGNLLGINTAIFSRSGGYQGIGFAIPSNLARMVMEDIVTNGRVIRGWLGIEIQQMTPILAESFGMDNSRGLIVAGIFRNSPAHQAGMQPGDILLSIDGVPITDARSAMNQIAQTKPGETMVMEVLREKQTLSLPVTIGDRPPSSEG